MPRKVFLDESGDLGFKFDAPYRAGGSSRYLTIGYLIVPDASSHIPKRLVKDVYNKLKLVRGTEVKGATLDNEQKKAISKLTVNMLNKNPEFVLGAITVQKEKVFSHITKDPNILYNYLIRRSILYKIDKSPQARIIRDNRSVKVVNGKSCIDYLQTTLWFDHGSETQLYDHPTQSHTSLNIIFIDWITNIIWSHYESGRSDSYNILAPKLNNQTFLF